MMTEIGVSELDAMVDQMTCAWRVGAPTLRIAVSAFELPPSEELVSGEKVFQPTKYYPSQSAKTLLKDPFELNIPTVLDTGNTTTNITADGVTQFARTVGPEVNVTSLGLLEYLLVRSIEVCAVGSHGVPGKSQRCWFDSRR